MKSLLVLAILLVGLNSKAEDIANPLLQYHRFQQLIVNQAVSMIDEDMMGNVEIMGLPWKTGESASYNLDMGFVKGTAVMKVREETAKAFWLDQDMDLGFMGQQKVEILIDKNTGQILELIVNGQKQQPPEPGENEVEETRQDRVTVPKGTFDCIYARIKDIKKNQTSEAWINPSIVPIMGMIKQVSPGPFGNVTMELTDFVKK